MSVPTLLAAEIALRTEFRNLHQTAQANLTELARLVQQKKRAVQQSEAGRQIEMAGVIRNLAKMSQERLIIIAEMVVKMKRVEEEVEGLVRAREILGRRPEGWGL